MTIFWNIFLGGYNTGIFLLETICLQRQAILPPKNSLLLNGGEISPERVISLVSWPKKKNHTHTHTKLLKQATICMFFGKFWAEKNYSWLP